MGCVCHCLWIVAWLGWAGRGKNPPCTNVTMESPSFGQKKVVSCGPESAHEGIPSANGDAFSYFVP